MAKPLLLCFIFLFTGFSFAQKNIQTIPVKADTQTFSLASFDKINISGNFDVYLHNAYKKPTLTYQGSARDLLKIKTVVQNNELSIRIDPPYPKYGPIRVIIKASSLHRIKFQGRGAVVGKQLQTKFLDVFVDNSSYTQLGGDIGLHKLVVTGNGPTEISGIRSAGLILCIGGRSKVKLTGVANLASVDIKNNAALSLYWIKSKNLSLKARDQSYFQLAGIVDQLEVELWGKARFQGRYLRANRAFVKTHQNSIAEITALKRQHTLASDNSDIRFYEIPEMKTDFMAYNGAVLDMRDLGWPNIKEYDLYNK